MTKFDFIKTQLTQIRKDIKQMAIDQQTFDTDLSAFLTQYASLIQAIDAALANKPAADMTPEDQLILTAAQQASAELNKLNPPTPVPAPAPVPSSGKHKHGK